ncbi:MAG: CreA family protein [Alphaproteobacteria bacterium]
MRFFAFLLLLIMLAPSFSLAESQRVGQKSTDWVGNDVVVDALPDPKIKGVVCYLSRFQRSAVDRVVGMFKSKNPFVDPSNSSLACRQIASAIEIGDIDMSKSGEEIFNHGISLIFRDLKVLRMYDKENNVLVYLSYSTRILEGSAKSSVSVVPLYGQAVTWLGKK